eukprot:comp21497_c0_seq1/m.46861 comp21497_c0_seq1/g.46861  ORF comp21497_c0_seq1/g.46861 comp21497_c0_seq1/m.46861 type:complete len:340 (-) comp21497_c0_seq1:769-1788(-)
MQTLYPSITEVINGPVSSKTSPCDALGPNTQSNSKCFFAPFSSVMTISPFSGKSTTMAAPSPCSFLERPLQRQKTRMLPLSSWILLKRSLRWSISARYFARSELTSAKKTLRRSLMPASTSLNITATNCCCFLPSSFASWNDFLSSTASEWVRLALASTTLSAALPCDLLAFSWRSAAASFSDRALISLSLSAKDCLTASADEKRSCWISFSSLAVFSLTDAPELLSSLSSCAMRASYWIFSASAFSSTLLIFFFAFSMLRLPLSMRDSIFSFNSAISASLAAMLALRMAASSELVPPMLAPMVLPRVSAVVACGVVSSCFWKRHSSGSFSQSPFSSLK